MIELYYRHRLKVDTMPEEYQHLAEFACRRLDHCRYGENKTACKDFPTHCYAPNERELIREVMRWVGPIHLIDNIKKFKIKFNSIKDVKSIFTSLPIS